MSEALDIMVTWAQNLSLLLRQDVELPNSFNFLKQLSGAWLRLDINQLPYLGDISLPNIPNLTKLEFRAQFILVTILFPLFLSLITLVLFENLISNLWFVSLLLGLLLTAVGIAGFIIPQSKYSLMQRIEIGDLNLPVEKPQWILIGVGICFLLLFIVVGAVFCVLKRFRKNRASRKIHAKSSRRVKKRQDPKHAAKMKKYGSVVDGADFNYSDLKKDKKKSQTEEMMVFYEYRSAKTKFSWNKCFVNSCTIIFLLIVGFLLMQIVRFETIGVKNSPVDQTFSNGSVRLYSALLGVGCWLVSIVFCCQICCLCCKHGRTLEYYCVTCCKFNSLKVIMSLVTLMFTPIISSLFTSLMCKQEQCSAGYRFPVSYNALSLDTVFSETNNPNSTLEAERYDVRGKCERCIFHQNCNCTITDSLCPSLKSFRLDSDASIACWPDMVFFWPATFILAALFIVGVPCFFYVLIRRSSSKLRNFDVEPLLDQYVPLWVRKPGKANKLRKKYFHHVKEEKERQMEHIKRRKKRGKPKVKPGEHPFEQSLTAHTVIPGAAPIGGKNKFSPYLAGFKPKEFMKMNLKKHPMSEYEFLLPTLKNTPELVIRRRLLEQKYSSKKMKRKHENQRWRIRTALTKTPTRSLYHAFERRWRYFRMFNIIVKLILVVISICLIYFPYISLPLTAIIHLIIFLVLTFGFPYLHLPEDGLSSSQAFVSFINTLIVFVAFFTPVPWWMIIPFLIINGAFVLCAVLLFLYASFARAAAKKRYKKILMKLEKLQMGGDINHRKELDFQELHENHHDTDELLLIDSMDCVSLFFKFVGVLTFVSLFVCLVGILYGEFNPKYIPNQYSLQKYTTVPETCEDLREREFAEYESWDKFTENCCCQVSDHHKYSPLNYHLKTVEMWSCKNGNSKEFVRELELDNKDGDTITIDGTPIRDVCSKTFNYGYNLITPCLDGKAKYSYVNGTHLQVHKDADSTDKDDFNSLKYYW